MVQLAKTPDRNTLPLPDDNGEPSISSPLKPLVPPVAGHNAEELAQRTMPSFMRAVSVDGMWKLLGTSDTDMAKVFHTLPKMETVVKAAKLRGVKSAYEQYVDYLNIISRTTHEKEYPAADLILFYDRHHIPPKGHPTGTTSCPDFLASRVSPHDTKEPSAFYWSALEATGELLSADDKAKSTLKTASYTSYLLQARPDRVAVQGIYVDHDHFRLIFSNACGAFCTGLLQWEPRSFRLLLGAWVWRLYCPFVDPSITVNFHPDKAPTFKIVCPNDVYKDCSLHTVGRSFGRRTVVLKTENPDRVIKEQYIETSRRFEEGKILSKIHIENTCFPGVVRPGWNGPVTSDQGELIVGHKDGEGKTIYERKKTRMVMRDKGESLMDVETLRDVLIILYDLMEATRILHICRKVFHRDISIDNVLVRKEFPTPDPKQPFAADLLDMCFASHLLNSKSANSRASRLDTRLLLIDFDLSEDQEWKPEDRNMEKGPKPRTGTPIFMARAVRTGKILRGKFVISAMPQLSIGRDVYANTVGGRLIAFPANEDEVVTQDSKTIEPFTHKLRYDAESVFWLLFWWAIQVQPGGDDRPEADSIEGDVWGNLTGWSDQRDTRVGLVAQFPEGVLHPFYMPLETLLQDMASQLRGDLGECTDPSRKKDEYLHEAFQRLIFEFLFQNHDEPFMSTKKNPNNRMPEGRSPMHGSKSTAQINKIKSSTASRHLSSSVGDLRSSDRPSRKHTPDTNAPIKEDVEDESYREPGRRKQNNGHP